MRLNREQLREIFYPAFCDGIGCPQELLVINTYHHQENPRSSGAVGQLAPAFATRSLVELEVRSAKCGGEHRHERTAEGPEGVVKGKVRVVVGVACRVFVLPAGMEDRVEGQGEA